MATPPVRITAVHRSGLTAVGDGIDTVIPPGPDATVGDWLLFNAEFPKDSVVLDRKSVVKRRAAGHDRQVQLIAANIDTSFIVTSCNQEFNIARLERYIALAMGSDITPVIVLTKLDLCTEPDQFIEAAKAIYDLVQVVALDARGDQPRALLAPWCKPWQTVAFLGSSGVGKSTLTNALAGGSDILTQAIRDGDGRGRHTTTHRELHFVPGGCAVLDTPGMRELQMTDLAAGIGRLFADIQDLTTQCKFNDCAHETEPGCAVRAALEAGDIDLPRLERWKKLAAEDRFNSATLAKRKTQDLALGKKFRAVQKKNKK